jgi:hypothetical protein
MSELWEDVAALGEARHRVVMALLNAAFGEADAYRTHEIFAAIDEVNAIVDDVDKANSVSISRTQRMLETGLEQLHRGALTARRMTVSATSATPYARSDQPAIVTAVVPSEVFRIVAIRDGVGITARDEG